MGSVDAVTGANRPWAANQKIREAGSDSGITSLSTDGTNIYGTAFHWKHAGTSRALFSAAPSTGALHYANDCHGDTYDAFPVGEVVYTVSHAHDCRWIRSFPQKGRNVAHHALAFTTYPTTTNIGPDNYGWNYSGVGASRLLQWFPTLSIGSYTGQNQAAWTTSGNSDYIVLGGEFLSVNGVAQQGLVRFAVPSKAPNKRGPGPRGGRAQPHRRGVSQRTGPRHLAVRLRHGQRGIDLQRLPLRDCRPGIHDDGELHLLELPDAVRSRTPTFPPGRTRTRSGQAIRWATPTRSPRPLR